MTKPIEAPDPGAGLYFGDGTLIWRNPLDIGFFGVKIRKQLYEQRLCKRLEIRWRVNELIKGERIK